MIFQGCYFKNVGVAGYVEAFGIVQLENQASYMGYLFRNRCTRIVQYGYLLCSVVVANPLQYNTGGFSISSTLGNATASLVPPSQMGD